MDPYRKNRLNQSILKVLCDLLQTSVKDPRVGFISINKVELNRDNSVALVFWSLLGEEDDRGTCFSGLKKARGFLQSKISRTLGLRQSPDLRFVYDDSIEKGIELDNVFDEMHKRGELLTEADKRRQLKLADIQPPPELITALRESKFAWIVPHFNPDPDSIGAALALSEALDEMGRETAVVAFNDPPVGLTDLPGYEYVVPFDEAQEAYEEDQPDLLILVDCHRIDRTGPLEEILERFENRVCIDHHLISGRKVPEAGWVEPRACSTCALVHQVIENLGQGDPDYEDEAFELNLDMGTNIYAGLISDTGGFRFSNTLPFTFELAGKLSSLGVDTAQVARTTMYRNRPEGLAMLQHILASFEYHAGGEILIAKATQEMLAESGAKMSDTEGFVNIASAVDGVRFIAFMKERAEGVWRVSLRARGEGDVQSLAARYGGGGHQQAAGLTIEGTANEVAATMVLELSAELN